MNPPDQPEQGHEMARALPVGPRRPHTPRGLAAAHRSLTLPAATDTTTVGTSTAEKTTDTPKRMGIAFSRFGQDRRMAGLGPGPVRGAAQRGKNVIRYEVGSGLPYKVSCGLPPATADKVVRAALAMNGSVSGLLAALVDRMEVDETGAPAWYEPADDLQQKLIA